MRMTQWAVLGLWMVVGLMVAMGGWRRREMGTVERGVIGAAVYEAEEARLMVVFRDGGAVVFRDVGPGQFEELMRAEDRAGYLYREVLSGCGLEYVAP